MDNLSKVIAKTKCTIIQTTWLRGVWVPSLGDNVRLLWNIKKYYWALFWKWGSFTLNQLWIKRGLLLHRYPLGHWKGLTSPYTRGFGVDTGHSKVNAIDLFKPSRYGFLWSFRTIAKSGALSGEVVCHVGEKMVLRDLQGQLWTILCQCIKHQHLSLMQTDGWWWKLVVLKSEWKRNIQIQVKLATLWKILFKILHLNIT